MANIAHGLKRSRRVILIVTPEFLKSSWTEFEVAQAVQHAVDKKRQIIIPLLYEVKPDDVPNYIKSINYIEYSSPDFMIRLQRALVGNYKLVVILEIVDKQMLAIAAIFILSKQSIFLTC